MYKYVLIGILLSMTAATAGELNHDAVVPFPQDASNHQRQWAPRFTIEEGCDPTAAVDRHGNWNGGLSPTGSEDGQCRNLPDQVYARSRSWTGEGLTEVFGLPATWGRLFDDCGFKVRAYVYSLYFPKDMFMALGIPIPNAGHRHDWESVVIWTLFDDNHAIFLQAGYSQHGGYLVESSGEDNNFLDGHLLVKYKRSLGTHAFMPTGHQGFQPELISWGRMTTSARNRLNVHDWGDANCPMNDNNFMDNINKSEPPLGLAMGILQALCYPGKAIINSEATPEITLEDLGGIVQENLDDAGDLYL